MQLSAHMEALKDNPAAFYKYVVARRDRLVGLDLLRKALEDGSWRQAPDKWAATLHWHVFWSEPTTKEAVELRDRLVELLLGGVLDTDARACLESIFHGLRPHPLERLPELVSWLANRATPNDATLIANLVEAVVYQPESEECAQSYPLVTWLLQKGSRELKSPRRALLLGNLLDAVAKYGDERGDELLATLRFRLFSDAPIGGSSMKFREVEHLTPALERLLGRPDAASIELDLFSSVSGEVLSILSENVLTSWRRFPRLRRAVLRHLASLEKLDESVWRLAMRGPPVPITWAHPGAIHELVSRHHMGSDPHIPLDALSGEWGRIVISEFLGVTQAIELSTEDLRHLGRWLNDDQFAKGAARAFREAIEASPRGDIDTARSLLAEEPENPRMVWPSIEVLLGTPHKKAHTRPVRRFGFLERAIAEFVTSAPRTIGSVDLMTMVADVRRVSIGQLENERAFVIDGGTLSVARQPLERRSVYGHRETWIIPITYNVGSTRREEFDRIAA